MLKPGDEDRVVDRRPLDSRGKGLHTAEGLINKLLSEYNFQKPTDGSIGSEHAPNADLAQGTFDFDDSIRGEKYHLGGS